MLAQLTQLPQCSDLQSSALISRVFQLDHELDVLMGSLAVKSPIVEKTDHQKFKLLLGAFLASDKRLSYKCKFIPNNGTPVTMARMNGGSDGFWMDVGCEFFCDDITEFQRAVGLIFEKTLLKHCRDIEDTLELGSGSYPINDFLAGISEQVKQRIQLSDFRPAVVAKYNMEHNPVLPMKVLDCKKLSSQLGTKRYACIVLNDVLSTFIRADLAKTCKEAYKVLLPEGVLINFTTRMSFFSVLVDEYTTDATIIFPCVERSVGNIGIYVIERSELSLRMATLEDSSPEKQAISDYMKLKNVEREDFCETADLISNEAGSLAYLDECIKKLNCPSMKRILFEPAFHARAKEELEKEGFKVIKSGYVEKSVIAARSECQRDKSNKHRFKYINGSLHTSYLGMLAPGMVQEIAKIHVLVAKKK